MTSARSARRQTIFSLHSVSAHRFVYVNTFTANKLALVYIQQARAHYLSHICLRKHVYVNIKFTFVYIQLRVYVNKFTFNIVFTFSSKPGGWALRGLGISIHLETQKI